MTEHDGVMTDQNGLGRTSEVRAGQSRSELLPCPFCGGAPRIQHLFVADEPSHSRVICTNCHVKTDYYVHEFGERNVVKVWNRRADHD